MKHDSCFGIESRCLAGVTFRIARVSFGRRLELMRRIRDLAQKAEFLGASSDAREQIEAAVLAREIDRTYVLWGLKEIAGLLLDGEPATPERLVELGPEEFFHEVLAAIKAECGLSEDERKN